MESECNINESNGKESANILSDEMAKSAEHDRISNQSTSSSTTQDYVHIPGTARCGSLGDESDLTNRETASPAESEDGTGDVFRFNRSLRGQHKSVCFHSVTCQPGERKITSALDCLQHMINGNTLIKVKASTRQYRRYYNLEEDLTAVCWFPSSKKSSKARLLIRRIKEVRTGKNAEVLKNKEIANTYSEDCIFSVIHGDDSESLNLIALSPEKAHIWVTGLNFLIGVSNNEPAMTVPAVLTGATLAPEPEPKQPPLTPTSPGDGRLRGILKKTSQTSSPINLDQNQTELNSLDPNEDTVQTIENCNSPTFKFKS